IGGAVDAIYHCGAAVKAMHSYDALRGPNVVGTHEVLRMAIEGGAKPVHFISTMGVVGAGGTEQHQSEDPSQLPTGDAQTKWVAEQLVRQAQARGVPCAIYRPGALVAHSRNGYYNPQGAVDVMLSASFAMGLVPDLDGFVDWLPVDDAARAVVRIASR